MNTEIYIENYRLDITTDISTLITFMLDDIKDFSSRSTSFSKTIVLPGTANNNKLFGHIFQAGQSNQYSPDSANVGYNFNASKSADCIIFQDQMQTFTGVLRLMQININKGQIEYEVAVFGKLASLSVSLSSGLLENLDFSAYDDTYSIANIVASWSNTPGSGVYYPLIDYGQVSADKHNFDYTTFRPALYVKEYVDKMFSAAGFRYESDLFNSARFKTFIVPHNQKKLTKKGTALASALVLPTTETIVSDPGTSMGFTGFSGTDWSLIFGVSFRYDAVPPITVNVDLHVEGVYISDVINPTSWLGLKVQLQYWPTGSLTPTVIGEVVIGTGGAFTADISVPGYLVNQNDFFQFRLIAVEDDGAYIQLTGGSMVVSSSATTLINVNLGDTVALNDTIPKNVRQMDFLVSLIKLFNLYIYEDRFDPNLIYIKPYVDFYSTDSSNAVDWSYKLNREKTVQVKPMSELNAKIYNFQFKSDSDFWNDTYKKRYGQGYGDYIFDSQYEFAEQSKAFELIFSATPLIGFAGEDKVVPAIYKQTNSIEEAMDSNIRILQSKKILGVTSWDISSNGGATVLGSYTDYPYAGHFDDPDDPTNDLNFGALKELFFTLSSGNLTATQFNVYWSPYMAEITDKDSKLLTGNFYLTTKDIYDLDFSKFIYLDGVLFRLFKITDYNTTTPFDCMVDLLKVNNLIY